VLVLLRLPVVVRGGMFWLSDFSGWDVLVFFFLSRRRHTRWPRDWSSDVCSSDLVQPTGGFLRHAGRAAGGHVPTSRSARVTALRSEERRVGKECREVG